MAPDPSPTRVPDTPQPPGAGPGDEGKDKAGGSQRRGFDRFRPPGPQGQFHLWYWVVAFGLMLLLQAYLSANVTERISYSEFLRLVDEGRVARVEVSDTYIRGELKPAAGSGGADSSAGQGDASGTPPAPAAGAAATSFVTTRVDPALVQALTAKGVDVAGTVDSTLIPTLLSWIVPVALFAGVWIFMSRRLAQSGLGGGLMQIGKSKAKVYVQTDTGVTFADVAGVDEAKAELVEVVEFLKDPERYGRLGGRMPKGVLLVGPPGTGKTLLARAVAGEAGVPFLSISGSEFVEMFVGVGAARVRDLFQQAREKAPAIIFIDELDALGRARGAVGGLGGHDEKEQTLNQLLVELDGFDTAETGLVLLGATNRPEILDPALLRAGRFDRQVLVDRPDRPGRAAILAVHVKGVTLAPGIDLDEVAALTPGFTGADLANLVNEAALLATRRGAAAVEMEDFSNAVERIVAGLEKRNRLINPRERRIVAFHETGHALVALSLPGIDPVHKISIIPRGVGALGYTIQRPTEDRFLMTGAELRNKMAVLLGGRAAEKLVFGHLSTGAADDLQKVTDIARAMVSRYGMSARLGHVAYDTDRRAFLPTGEPAAPRDHGDATQTAIDEEVRALVAEAMAHSMALLEARRAWLDRTAEALLEAETLDQEQLSALVAEMPREAPEAARDAAE